MECNEKKKDIIKKLQSKGYRVTKQRRILLDVIMNNEIASCKEIYYLVNKVDSSMGIATVYRMINTLQDLGIINPRNLYKIEC